MSGSNSTRLLKFPSRGAAVALRLHARVAIGGGPPLALARLRVRAHGEANRHRLGIWREDPDRPGVEMIACIHCGAGASIHREDARESVAAELLQVCGS